MLIVVTALFEGVVHSAYVRDPSDPTNPRLEIDALVREGDLDGPVWLSVPMFRVFCPTGTTRDAVASLRRRNRIEYLDGVAHVRFSTWTFGMDAILSEDAVSADPGNMAQAADAASEHAPNDSGIPTQPGKHLRAVTTRDEPRDGAPQKKVLAEDQPHDVDKDPAPEG